MSHINDLQIVEKPFFSFSPDTGFQFFASEPEAKDSCQEMIDEYRRSAEIDNEWEEASEQVFWGSILGRSMAMPQAREADEPKSFDFQLKTRGQIAQEALMDVAPQGQ